MSNSCGADGLGVSGLQSPWISLPITHLAPVAISPRALWWRRPPRRPLGAGAFALFSGLRVPPICLAHECAPAASACSAPSPSRVPELERFTFAPVSSFPPPAPAPPLSSPPPPPPPGFRSLSASPLPPSHPCHPQPGLPPSLHTPAPRLHPNIGRSSRRPFPGYHFHS